MVAKKAKTTTHKATAAAESIEPEEKQESTKPEEQHRRSPVVTQMVVEVEEETSKDDATIKELEKDTKAVEDAAQKLEEDIDKTIKHEELRPTVGPTKEDETQSAESKKNNEELTGPQEKRNEMVKEFFKPESTGITPEIAAYQGNGNSRSVVLWVAIILVVALLTGAVLMVFVRGVPKSPFFTAKPTPTPTIQPQPTPTPEPTVNRADLKVQVLNGGGVAGAGSKMKQFLEGKGYTVANVGNTQAYSYENTEILVKPDKEAFLSLLQSDLKNDYTLGTTAATLSSDSSYDARIIVGKE